jgi:hypothetical protein
MIREIIGNIPPSWCDLFSITKVNRIFTYKDIQYCPESITSGGVLLCSRVISKDTYEQADRYISEDLSTRPRLLESGGELYYVLEESFFIVTE